MMASCVTCADFLEWTVHKLKYFLAMGDIIARRNETYIYLDFVSQELFCFQRHF